MPISSLRGDTAVVEQKTVLVVEDEDVVRMLVVEILSKAGHRVLEAKNGIEALHLCERTGGSIDLLLTDLVMPQMGGIELADRLKKLTRDIPTVFMSGFDITELAISNQENDCAVFMSKPFTVDGLIATITKLFNSPQSESELISPETL